MRNNLISILLSTITIIVFLIPDKAKSQQNSLSNDLSCSPSTEVVVRVVDKSTVICRNVNPNRFNDAKSFKVIDELKIHRWNMKIDRLNMENDYLEAFILTFSVYDNGRILVTMLEHKGNSFCKSCERKAQFYLKGRTFDEWVSPGIDTVDIQLLEKYKKDVTLILDALESSSVKKISF